MRRQLAYPARSPRSGRLRRPHRPSPGHPSPIDDHRINDGIDGHRINDGIDGQGSTDGVLPIDLALGIFNLGDKRYFAPVSADDDARLRGIVQTGRTLRVKLTYAF